MIGVRDFLELSAVLNYQLSGDPVDWEGVCGLLLGGKSVGCKDDIFLPALRNLVESYSQRKRRLGTFAVLHPLRVAAFLARTHKRFSCADLLCAMYHDRNEDVTEEWSAHAPWDEPQHRQRPSPRAPEHLKAR